jgi:hypothetical protein
MSRRVEIDERLCVSLRRGGFKIKHLVQIFRVSEFKIYSVLRKYPDARSPVNHRILYNTTEAACAQRRRLLDWCPDDLKPFYRRLLFTFRRDEARRIVEDEIARRAARMEAAE